MGWFNSHDPWMGMPVELRIRESLSSVFMEITAAVRNNAAADQEQPRYSPGVGWIG